MLVAQALRELEREHELLAVSGITRSYLPGAPIYAIATLIALVSPVASLIIFGAVALFYAISSSFFGRDE